MCHQGTLAAEAKATVLLKRNESMSVSDIIKMVTEFEKVGMKMEAKSEAMGDAMGALGDLPVKSARIGSVESRAL